MWLGVRQPAVKGDEAWGLFVRTVQTTSYICRICLPWHLFGGVSLPFASVWQQSFERKRGYEYGEPHPDTIVSTVSRNSNTQLNILALAVVPSGFSYCLDKGKEQRVTAYKHQAAPNCYCSRPLMPSRLWVWHLLTTDTCVSPLSKHTETVTATQMLQSDDCEH